MLPNYPFALQKEDSGLHAPQFCSAEVEYMDILYSLCASIDAEHILEIGTCYGFSTWWFFQWVKRKPEGQLHTVDTNPVHYLIQPDILNCTQVHIHTKKSDEFFQSYLGLLDFVFIDGGHTYAQCKRDFKNAVKAHASIIAIHDTVYHKAEVGKVIKEEQDAGLWTHFPFGKGMSYVRRY